MENLRGSLLMVLAMACFSFEDTMIKSLSDQIPVGQLMLLIGLGGVIVFWALLARRGMPLWSRDLLLPIVMWRSFGEFIGALGFVAAIALTPISSATAILMAAPLATVLGAALFLGEPVGWRRWSAIAAGFIGVLLVVKPGTDGFQAESLLAVLGVAGLVLRDLLTNRVPKHIPSLQISAAAYLSACVSGIVMLLIWRDIPVVPEPGHWPALLGMIAAGAVGYMAIVTSTRIAELSVVMPLRYARLVFAMIVGVTFFNERPDALTLLGMAIIVASGLYSIWREAKLRRSAASLARPTAL